MRTTRASFNALRMLPILALLVALAPGQAGAQVIATGPNAQTTGYTGVVFVAVKGQPLEYVNGDITVHNVVSDAIRTAADPAPHCLSYPCPLFTSGEPIGVGETTTVEGLDDLETGVLYPFFCAPHPSMRAFLVVVEA
jgi:plastocyanin